MDKKLLEVGDVIIWESCSGDMYKLTISRVTPTLAIVTKSDGRELRFKREIESNWHLSIFPRGDYYYWSRDSYRYATQDLLNLYKKKILQKQLIKQLDEFKKNVDKCSYEDLYKLHDYIKNIEFRK